MKAAYRILALLLKDEISAPVAAAALRGHGVYTSKDIAPISFATSRQG